MARFPRAAVIASAGTRKNEVHEDVALLNPER